MTFFVMRFDPTDSRRRENNVMVFDATDPEAMSVLVKWDDWYDDSDELYTLDELRTWASKYHHNHALIDEAHPNYAKWCALAMAHALEGD